MQQQDLHGLGEPIKHRCGPQAGSGEKRFLFTPSARAHQGDRAHPCRLSGLQVADGIPNQERGGEVETEGCGRLKDQARLGFAAGAGDLGAVWAEEDPVDPGPAAFQRSHQFEIDGLGALECGQSFFEHRPRRRSSALNTSPRDPSPPFRRPRP